MARINDRIMI